MIRVFKSILEWTQFREVELSNTSLGFVPTMGALHAGHQALVEKSVRENARTLVSIFVNPTQFNDPQDFKTYPVTLDADSKLLQKAGSDYLLFPDYNELYPDHYTYKISEKAFSTELCGAHRLGHFDGVLTVVMKLLQIANAKRAYFGEKDYQQLSLIEEMKKAFFIKTEIVPVPTVRERDGLAMSSRNLRLTAQEREIAPLFYKLLSNFELSSTQIKYELTSSGFVVDYVEERVGRRLGAAVLGSVRLIDNVEMKK